MRIQAWGLLEFCIVYFKVNVLLNLLFLIYIGCFIRWMRRKHLHMHMQFKHSRSRTEKVGIKKEMKKSLRN